MTTVTFQEWNNAQRSDRTPENFVQFWANSISIIDIYTLTRSRVEFTALDEVRAVNPDEVAALLQIALATA